MPELAAHLERVAKELARDLEKRGFLSSETFRAEVEPILAAALAACAREEIRPQQLSQDDIELALKDYDPGFITRETVRMRLNNILLLRTNERLAALERAAGEKA